MASGHTCKADGCNTIVADDTQDFCRSCRAKLASVKQELTRDTTSSYAGARVETDDGIATGVGLAGAEDELEPTLEESFGLLDASDKRRIQRALNNHIYRQPPKPENGYLPFQVNQSIIDGSRISNNDWILIASPQCLFRPEALMLWGYDDDTVITNLYIGQRVQGAASFGELPASFFGTAKTYEKLIEDLGVNGISPPNWITWQTANVGQNVHIAGKGKLRHAVMLGKLQY